MKRFISLILIFVLVWSIAACGSKGDSSQETPDTTPKQPSESQNTSAAPDSSKKPDSSDPETPKGEEKAKALVVYFSCTGNTKAAADKIVELTAADRYEIVPKVPYTAADLNYNNSDCRANREQNDSAARPEISGSVENIEQYDVIFIGYPIWWGQAPKILYTFFESYDYDFEGVTIIPFCTSGSSGIGSSAENLHGLAPRAAWKAGARVSGNQVGSLIEQMNEAIRGK